MFDNERFAALLCDWCLDVQPGQRILIGAESVAEPLLAALHVAVLERGAWMFPLMQPAGQPVLLLEHGGDRHLDHANPFELALFDTADSLLRIMAPTNTRERTGADPAKVTRLARAGQALRERQMARRWAISIWPTAALAQDAGMSLAAYERFLTSALFLDRPDAVAAWQALHDHQQTLVDRLTPATEVRIQSDRTDLTLNVENRVWINSDGRRNMPSGEVFTSPHESSANGQIHFDVPSNLDGSVVSGITLTFVDGVVTEAHAEVGDDRLQAALNTDAGARRLGEIGIGTNFGIDRATGSTLLDEKIGGSIHLALGMSYAECLGENESSLHWDIVCDLRGGGEITVDGESFSRDGQFV